MNINEIIPSRMYSAQCQYSADEVAERKMLLKGGRNGLPPNPLLGRVSKYAVYAGQAASAEMYVSAQLALNPKHEFGTRPPNFEAIPEHPCIVRSLATGKPQLRMIKPRTTKLVWYVDGQAATEEQLAIIRMYKPTKTRNPLNVKIMFPYTDHVSNMQGNLQDVTFEEEED